MNSRALLMSTPKILPPPAGYASWLDYAVDTMDVRSIETVYLFEDVSTAPTREAVCNSARAELEALRRAAATISPEPDNVGGAVPEMHAFIQAAEPMGDVDIKGLIEDGRA